MDFQYPIQAEQSCSSHPPARIFCHSGGDVCVIPHRLREHFFDSRTCEIWESHNAAIKINSGSSGNHFRNFELINLIISCKCEPIYFLKATIPTVQFEQSGRCWFHRCQFARLSRFVGRGKGARLPPSHSGQSSPRNCETKLPFPRRKFDYLVEPAVGWQWA